MSGHPHTCRSGTKRARAVTGLSLDHLVGGRHKCIGNRQIQSPRGLQVDNEIELDGLFDRKLCRSDAAENARNEISRAAEGAKDVRSVGHKFSERWVSRRETDRWQFISQRKDRNFSPCYIEHGV